MTPGFSEWYEKNKDELLARRRQKYADDTEYRKKQKARAAKYRKKHKPKKRDKRSASFVRVLICDDGRHELVWSFTVLARNLGACAKTCDGWQRRGLLPGPLIKIGKTRYYTIDMIRKAAELYAGGPTERKAVELSAAWRSIYQGLNWKKGKSACVDDVRFDIEPGFAVNGIGVFSLNVDKTVDAIWKWHNNDWLPMPCELGGRPVYTDKMIDLVRKYASGARIRCDWLKNKKVQLAWSREQDRLKKRLGDLNNV